MHGQIIFSLSCAIAPFHTDLTETAITDSHCDISSLIARPPVAPEMKTRMEIRGHRIN